MRHKPLACKREDGGKPSLLHVRRLDQEREARLHIAVVLQQVGKAQGGQAQHNAGLVGVKHVDDEDAKVTLQPRHITL